MVQDSVAVGRKIKELREARKITDPRFSLRQFAESVDLSPTFISRLENGSGVLPKPENLQRIAEALGVEPRELFELAQRVEPEVTELLVQKPAWADFLRTASSRNLSAEDAQKIIDKHFSPSEDEI